MRAREAVEILNACTSPDCIADIIREAGIKGIPEDSEACAISAWIERNVDCYSVSTSDVITIYGNTDDEYDPEWKGDYNISTNVERFITLFDQGFYPDLLVEEEHDEDVYMCTCPGCQPNYDS